MVDVEEKIKPGIQSRVILCIAHNCDVGYSLTH